MSDTGGRIQASLGPCQCLKEVSPKYALVRFVHLVKSRAESKYVLGDLRRKHFCRQRLFNDLVPLRIPRRSAQFDFLLVDRRWRSRFRSLRLESRSHSGAKYKTSDQ